MTLAGIAQAQPAGNFRNQGYLLDNVGSSAAIQAPTSGVCVRTTEWTPARAIAECDPELTSKPAAPKPVAVVAKPVAAAPAPAPKPAAPKPVIQKFSLSADALFDFDKSVIKPEGMRKLDELVATLKGAQYDAIAATGHTDRLGSVDYNQRLSHRRAEAVRTYLAGKGLDGARISAVGKGKSQPVTKPADCKGKAGKALHACLQPDRRVDIEVSGSKTVTIAAPAAAAVKPSAGK
jgi:OmpA-OmpF porin, OOP family